MSGESSERLRKRDPLNHSPTDNKKKNKKITDRKARQENKDIVENITDAAPILTHLLEAIGSIGEDDWQQRLTYIQDAIGEAVNKEVSPLRNALQNVMQTMPSYGGCKNGFSMISQTLGTPFHQNLPQSTAFAEQPNNQYEYSPMYSLDPGLFDGLFDGLEANTMYPENKEIFDVEQVKTFLQECDGSTKRQVKYSDFDGLQEELNKVEHNCFPLFLGPIIQKIKETYGDITEKSTLSSCAAHPTLVIFYTTIKEMDGVREIEDVHISKLRVWRDAICDALQINMEVGFAKQHLIKIAHAYFASKKIDPKFYDRKKTLETELEHISTMLELHGKCQSEAIFFNDKSLNMGLFP